MKKTGPKAPQTPTSGRNNSRNRGQIGTPAPAGAAQAGLSVDAAMRAAIGHHQAGRLQQAEAIYREIIAHVPHHPDALHYLGLIAHQAGQNAAAAELISKAIATRPNAKMHYNLGVVLHALGSSDKAMENFRQAVDLDPAYADAHFRLGMEFYARFMFEEAILCYRNALSVRPDQANVWNSLGNAFQVTGQPQQAIECYERAIALKEHYAEAFNNLGKALETLAQNEAAIERFHRALAIKSDYPEALNNLGNTLQARGQFKEAIECYRRALLLTGDYAEAWNNLGNALAAQGESVEAIASLQRAAAIKPHFADPWYNMGNILLEKGDLTGARENYSRALAIRENYPEALNNLGSVFEMLGDLAEAEGSFTRAIAIRPDYAEAHYNLGNALQAQGKYASSVECYARALSANPDYAEACYNQGKAFEALGKLDAAEANYRKAIAINADYPEAHNNLGNVVLTLGRPVEAAEHYRRALGYMPDYPEALNNLGNALQEHGELDAAIGYYRRALEIRPEYAEAHSNLLLSMSFMPHCSVASYLLEALRYGATVSARAEPYTCWKGGDARGGGRPLRVGLVSGDLRMHPVGIFLENVLVNLDSRSLELIAYSTSPRQDELTQRIKMRFSAWHTIAGMNDQIAAQRIHDDRIDILVDLAGHTAGNRLPVFAWRPSPVQLTWLGYFASTGMAAVDYVLCDKHVFPDSEKTHFTEKPWHLPHTRLCFSPPLEDFPVGPLPSASSGAVMFGCFNNLAKMNDEVVAVWSRVLHAVDGSSLFLKSRQLSETITRERTLARFAAYGIESERLKLEGPSSRSDYFLAYRQVDIALDPFPYTGGTTSVEALYMGVPFVTKRGDRFLGRQGESMLENLDLSGLVAENNDDYVMKAACLAKNKGALAALRSGLRTRLLASPLCDAKLFAQHLDAALHSIWGEYCGRGIT